MPYVNKKDTNPKKPGVQKNPNDRNPNKPGVQWPGRKKGKLPPPPPGIIDITRGAAPPGGGAGLSDLPVGFEVLATLPWVQNILSQAMQNDWNDSQLAAAIMGAPEFSAMFPGIWRADGSMKVTVAEYRDYADQYQAVAGRFGYDKLPGDIIGELIGGDVSNEELADRLTAVKKAQEVSAYKDNFKKYLAAAGFDGNVLDSPAGALAFVTGQLDTEFYSIYEKANISTAAQTAGFTISEESVEHVEKLQAGFADEATLQQSFSKLAQQARQILPKGRAYGFGVSEADLVELEFGGPRQAEVADRVQRVLATDEAQQQPGLRSAPGQQRPKRAQSL